MSFGVIVNKSVTLTSGLRVVRLASKVTPNSLRELAQK